jgi:hypothetical protein
VTPAMLDAIFTRARAHVDGRFDAKLIDQLLSVNVDLVINYAPQFVCSKRG